MTEVIAMSGKRETLAVGNYEVSLPVEYCNEEETARLIEALNLMANLEAHCGYKFNRLLSIPLERVLN